MISLPSLLRCFMTTSDDIRISIVSNMYTDISLSNRRDLLNRTRPSVDRDGNICFFQFFINEEDAYEVKREHERRKSDIKRKIVKYNRYTPIKVFEELELLATINKKL